MKLTYDPAVDALYLRLGPQSVVESEEVRPGVVLDFDAAGEVVGIEILDVRSRRPDAKLQEMEIEVAA